MKGIMLASAEKMPEESYSFKPVDSVRSYGQLVGQLADAQYLFCSTALGEKNPSPAIEKSKTSKVDLIAALKQAEAYCDKANNTMTDASGAQMVKLFGNNALQLDVLVVNNTHKPGKLRQHGHVHADQRHRPSDQRATIRATAEEMILTARRIMPKLAQPLIGGCTT